MGCSNSVSFMICPCLNLQTSKRGDGGLKTNYENECIGSKKKKKKEIFYASENLVNLFLTIYIFSLLNKNTVMNDLLHLHCTLLQ